MITDWAPINYLLDFKQFYTSSKYSKHQRILGLFGQSLPSTMHTSALLALKWPKHRKWQILQQNSVLFTAV